MKSSWIIVAVILVIVVIAGFALFRQPSDKVENENVVLTGEIKEFEIIAKQWEFVPNVIEVNKGDLVRLKIKSVDVPHGFTLGEFGISETLNPGEDVHIEFIASKTGVFNFFCHIPCGRGHSGMNGRLIVK